MIITPKTSNTYSLFINNEYKKKNMNSKRELMNAVTLFSGQQEINNK